MKTIFTNAMLVTLLVSCASKVKYAGDHGGQLYAEGNVAVEVVEKQNKTLDIYFYKRNKLLPAQKISLNKASIDALSTKEIPVKFDRIKDHFTGVAREADINEGSGAMLNLQVSEGNTTHNFAIPL